jgi:hypothetical protein
MRAVPTGSRVRPAQFIGTTSMRHILVAPTNYGGDRRISSIGAIIASSIAPSLSTTSGSQRQRRRFVRDGEMPVAVIRRDHQPDGEHGANQLDAARQAIRSEATAKERAERLLAEAQAMIRDLQTKLGHERLAKDEALETVRRLETETGVAAHAQETVAAELAAERLARRNADDALAEALAGRQEAQVRLRDAITVQETWMPPDVPKGRADATRNRQTALSGIGTEATPDPNGTARLYRGQPAGDEKPESDIVEWWEPGWQERFR